MPRPVLLLCILLLVRQSLCRPSLSNQLNNEISSETKEIVVSASDEQQGRQPMLRLSPSHGVMCYLLVSDFFCPNTGGIETHLYYLGGCLLERGHKVIVITHAYGRRKGIRYLSNGLKVYYLPFLVVYNSTTLSAVVDCLYWFRKIFLHEKIQIVHGHSSFSSMAHEAILHAWCLGIRTIFTDHSLFGFADASAILTNKLLLRYSLANVDKAICVSHTSKENLVLRAGLSPSNVFVIPNAIETSLFLPDPEKFYSNTTTVVILSRLAYRKGADLLVDIIPLVCQQHPKVRFLIAGDGPKRVELEEMREKHKLHNRVIMLGMLPHDKVREVMVEGQIFLNTSLTEAFCMSIVEAACCGLHVVSTKVGGVPEVLPSELVILEDTIPSRLSEGVLQAIYLRETNQLMDPLKRHEMVKKMYNWQDIAARTEIVYETAIATPQTSLRTRMKKNMQNQQRKFHIRKLIDLMLLCKSSMALMTGEHKNEPRNTI